MRSASTTPPSRSPPPPGGWFEYFLTSSQSPCITSGCREYFHTRGYLGGRVYKTLASVVVILALAGCNTKSHQLRSEEHTSELQSLMRISYAVFCLKKKKI